MPEMKCGSMDSNDDSNATKFYDDRYLKGYMKEWPIEKKQRVLEVINSLNLPERGDALDFGCGNGVFTDIIKQALPKWNVYGVDVSSIAVDNAKDLHSNCSFFLPFNVSYRDKRFDFVFTHHVLEHVYDVSETWHEINGYLKEEASVLHILPCGNKGSFEHRVCLLREDGINRDMEDKFYFEDISHLRRLNTDQMNRFAVTYGLNLDVDY